jgi:DNA-binding LacI/PurR family transcriptional regulator
MSISAKELAQKLNVSPATISMVLNNKPGISAETRDMVLSAAKKYGYDLTKYSPYTEKAKNICFLIYKKNGQVVSDTPFFSALTEGISNTCQANSLTLNILYVYANQPIEPQLKELFEKEYHGVLLLATEMGREDFSPFLQLPCPLVVLDCYYEDLAFDTILINNVQGSYVATSRLISNGFKQIGYLKSSFRIANFEERADGYYKALRDHSIKKDFNYVLELSPSMESAYSDMERLLKQGIPLAEAYFADNDLIAAGAMRALLEAGHRIPEEISIIGFDDISLCNFLSPPLSTMRVEKHDFGMLAVKQLQSRIQNPTQSLVKLELSTQLISRDSVRKE